MERFRPCRTAALGLALAAGLVLPAVGSAAVPPLDPQNVEDQQNMTFEDYKPIPGVDWATNGAVPTAKKVTIALVAFVTFLDVGTAPLVAQSTPGIGL